eukprot:m.307994 g.307994  ORF g.307994 m.307994 type:complete len:132 (+) comp43217_c0_seq1:376-771(+)
MKALDVAIFGVTSQPQLYAEKAEKSWRLNYKVHADPEKKLRQLFKEKGWVTLEVAKKKGYPGGMVQPGVLALDKSGEVVYAWGVEAGISNLYGATGRPSPKDVWNIIKERLAGNTSEMKKPSTYGMFKLKM